MFIFLNLSFSPYPVKMGCYVFTKAMEKSLQTWILKKSEMKPKKNRIGASALHQTPSGDYFLSFEIETWKPM